MCLIINHRNLKTANEDITVYKMLLKTRSGSLFAPYRTNFKYELNKLIVDEQEADIRKDKKGTRIVGKGFIHAFRTIPRAVGGVEEYLSRYSEMIERRRLTLCVFKAIIPKGTKFYEGKEWNICSKSIMIVEKITEILESCSVCRLHLLRTYLYLSLQESNFLQGLYFLPRVRYKSLERID